MKNYFEKIGLSSPKEEKKRQQTSLPLPSEPSKSAQRQQKRRKNHKRVEVYFTPEQYQQLHAHAKNHQLKVAPLVKVATLAYFQKLFILPDFNQLHELVLGIKRIGNNVNQIAYVSNVRKSVYHSQIEHLSQLVKDLEKLVHRSLTTPDDLEGLVKQALKEKPEFKITLEYLLNQDDY